MLDFLHKEIHVGDQVAFIYNKFSEARKILLGEVKKVNPSSINIEVPGDKVYRIMLSTSRYKDSTRMIKVLILPERLKREGEIKDLTDYPIQEGDRVISMQPSKFEYGESFMAGIVTAIKGSRVYLDAEVESGNIDNSKVFLEPIKTWREAERVIVIS